MQVITRKADPERDEWDEGYTLALSVDGSSLFLSARDREGNTVEPFPLSPKQAKAISDSILQHLDSISETTIKTK